ncbi:hypothetical protein SNEBB_006816 [Seison nebaliae]|nr:hypothetical protein SNEBB_006816 [Seison nebaliae]
MDFNFEFDEDNMGMKITPGSCLLEKDGQNLVGISIGGGAPNCPCVYIVQVFDNTPAAKDGSLAAGDEVLSINGHSVKGCTKVEVARLIQNTKQSVSISYNKLHVNEKKGVTLDILMKKMKHRMVEGMSAETADAFGLSRAILCNDGLIKRLNSLEDTTQMYNGLVLHLKRLLKYSYALGIIHRKFGDIFCEIAVRETQDESHRAFREFGEAHQLMEKYAKELSMTLKPVINDLNTYMNKAIPDTRLTVKKYADVKFEYLSYCLKVKELDDEEYAFAQINEPLYRVETGNYEYRLILRCRHLSRKKFAQMRQNVLEKLELLDSKHVQDIVGQLQRMVSGFSSYYQDCYKALKEMILFPIEIELPNECLTNDHRKLLQLPIVDDE